MELIQDAEHLQVARTSIERQTNIMTPSSTTRVNYWEIEC